jgi:hypothetical protein
MTLRDEYNSRKHEERVIRANLALSIEIPAWVLAKDRIEYRRIAARHGEEEAAAYARSSKRQSVVCKEA